MIIYFEDAVDGGELYTYNISVFVCCCSDWNSSYSVVETIVKLVLISHLKNFDQSNHAFVTP